MSEENLVESTKVVDLASFPAELQQVIRYENVEPVLFNMMQEIHLSSEPSVLEVWNKLPKSAQNILDNFSQFHALATLSQAYSGIDFMSQVQDQKFHQMTEEETEEYKGQLLSQLLAGAITDLGKDLKKARLTPTLKREYQQIFAK